MMLTSVRTCVRMYTQCIEVTVHTYVARIPSVRSVRMCVCTYVLGYACVARYVCVCVHASVHIRTYVLSVC